MKSLWTLPYPAKRCVLGSRGKCISISNTKKKDKEDNVYLKCLKRHGNNRDLIARLAIYYRDSGD